MTPVVLVGLMGSGKSTVGALVAKATGRAFVDVDVAIREDGAPALGRGRRGRVPRAGVRRRAPEPAPRRRRARSPGGVVLDPLVRTALRDAFVVWLRTKPATLAQRVNDDDHRPLLGQHPLAVLAKMADERAGLYEQVADLVVDTDHADAATVADPVVDRIRDPRLG